MKYFVGGFFGGILGMIMSAFWFVVGGMFVYGVCEKGGRVEHNGK